MAPIKKTKKQQAKMQSEQKRAFREGFVLIGDNESWQLDWGLVPR